MDYLKTKPTYMEFEAWVVQQNGGTLSPDTIKKHNDAITGYNHGDDLAKGMRSSSGVSNAGVADAVTLNTLEDLDELRAQVTA
jgi:hypothetical protein